LVGGPGGGLPIADQIGREYAPPPT
jgi:hypothetical protein